MGFNTKGSLTPTGNRGEIEDTMNLNATLSRGLIAASLLAPLSASAGFTKVGVAKFDGAEQTLIFGQLYGGSFQGEDGQYSNGAVSVNRVHDFENDKTDQRWDAGQYTVRSVAKFTSAEASFRASIINSPVLNVGEVGVDRTKSVKLTADDSFHWIATDYYGTSTSDVSRNSDDADHFVTYEVKGASKPSKYLLFWEDLPQTPGIRKTNKTWNDFNDLVIEVQSSAGNGAVIPLPPAALAGGVTMGLFSVISFLRKRMKR